MRGISVSDMPSIDAANIDNLEMYIPAIGADQNGRLSINSLVDAVKKSLGYLEKPLIKCKHCGQWGAVSCACAHCGAPIDPE